MEDEECIVDEVKFYGSPWQKWFGDWAFNMPREHKKYEFFAQEIWSKIPFDTNVLITHGQPYGINDRAPNFEYTGCKFLLDKIRDLPLLQLYVGGHIHCEYGKQSINSVQYVNASVCNEDYEPVNAPIVIDL